MTNAPGSSDRLPTGWKVGHRSKPSASFRNDQYELDLKISPKYRPSVSSGRGKAQKPREYRVEIIQDWFSTGMYGDHVRSTKVETWEEAAETAMHFMRNFNEDRAEVPIEDVETMHRSVDDEATAESLLTVEAATEALTDTLGYSDELLLDTILKETNGQYKVIAHREGQEIEYLAGADDDSLEIVPLEKVYAAFPVDKLGISSLLTTESILMMSITISGFTVYRFIFDDHKEITIVLEAGTQLVDPVFEQSIKNILKSKWQVTQGVETSRADIKTDT